MRLSGTISFSFEDLDTVSRSGSAQISVSLELETEALERAAADQFGWREYIAGQQRWVASASYHDKIDTDSDRLANLVALEDLALSRESFYVSFTSSTGNTYDGMAYIESFALNTAEEQANEVSVQFVGIGELTKTEAPT